MKIYSEIIESLREMSPLKQQFAMAAMGAVECAVASATAVMTSLTGGLVSTVLGSALIAIVVMDVSIDPDKINPDKKEFSALDFFKEFSPLDIIKDKKYWSNLAANVAAVAAGSLIAGALIIGMSSNKKEDVTPAGLPDNFVMLEEGSAQAQQPENIIAAKTPGGPSPS